MKLCGRVRHEDYENKMDEIYENLELLPSRKKLIDEPRPFASVQSGGNVSSKGRVKVGKLCSVDPVEKKTSLAIFIVFRTWPTDQMRSILNLGPHHSPAS